MADPLSVAASVIAVATVTVQSSKAVYECINGIVDAGTQLSALNEDIHALVPLLSSLQSSLAGTPDAELSPELQVCLLQAESTIFGCGNTCDELLARVQKITKHSSDGHMRLDDRFKWYFKEKELSAYQSRIASYKLSLSVALHMATLKAIGGNSAAILSLRNEATNAMNYITNQLQEIRMDKKASGGPNTESEKLKETLAALQTSFMECYELNRKAIEATEQASGGIEIKEIRALDDARQLITDAFGDVEAKGKGVKSEKAIAEGRSKQVVTRAVSNQAAADFFN